MAINIQEAYETKKKIGLEKKVHSQHDNQNTKYVESKIILKPATKNEYITEKGRLLKLHTTQWRV